MSHHEWQQPLATPPLGHNEVHVWRASLDVEASRVQWFSSTLAPDEQQRANQFRFQHLREHFIVGRGILRAMLGGYLGVAPHAISFGYTSYGKPFVEQEGQPPLHFNLTHTNSMALYAVSHARAVGIDIEAYRQLPDATDIAKQFFSPLENRTLAALPSTEQSAAFLRCWTRKEAYVKAQGMGLSLPLDQFSVTLGPDEPARLLHTDYDPAEAMRWTLCAIAPGPDYVAALAVEGQGWHLACWQWV